MVYNVFICHSYSHHAVYSELVKKLNDAKYFDWEDHSVPKAMRKRATNDLIEDEELKQFISTRVASCDVLLVLTKRAATNRMWLQREILFAKDLGKPVIGIARNKTDRVSSFVREHATDIVDTWRTDHIVNAIRGYKALAKKKRKKEAVLPQVAEDQRDDEVPAIPSPPAPEECQPLQPEVPRDVLFRNHTASIIPAAIPRLVEPQPKWWWPFDLGQGNS